MKSAFETRLACLIARYPRPFQFAHVCNVRFAQEHGSTRELTKKELHLLHFQIVDLACRQLVSK